MTKKKQDRRVEVFAVLLIALSFFVLLSLLTFNAAEEPTISEHVVIGNIMGIAGVYVSHYLIKFTIGYVAVFFPIMGIIWGAWLLFKRDHGPILRLSYYGSVLALLTSVALGIFQAPEVLAGQADFTAAGLVGGLLGKFFHDFLGMIGATILLMGIYFLTISGYLRWEVRANLEEAYQKFEIWFAQWREEQRRSRTLIESRSYVGMKTKKPPKSPAARRRLKDNAKADEVAKPQSRVSIGSEADPSPSGANIAVDEEAQVEESDVDTMEERQSKWRQYKFPPIDYLMEPPDIEKNESRDELLVVAQELERALLTFRVEGRVVRISPGPVITLFEIEPGEGVRVNKFSVLSDDLARIMSAEQIRIIAPIAGTKHIGIEIPNEVRSTVYLKTIISSEAYVESRSPLTIALGKTTTGEAFCFDLAKMPHLMVAGTTGSGKSVAINTIITSILYRAKPDEVKLVLIDPKKLELSSYQALEGYHLIKTPGIDEYVITDPKNAVVALRSMLAEMDRRYTLFTENTVRNIEEYQAKSNKDDTIEKVPYIVVIIDELADLMMTAGKDIEEPITRLAQMSRAVGIHLVIATQRPSVDVITGLIKANFPARIAFQVASKVDSRTILDQMGAEKLLGRGDLLYLPPGVSEPIRLHAAFISLDEINDILDYIKEQPQPEEIFLPEYVDPKAESEISIKGESDDLFEDAARLVVAHNQASVSMLQRRFRIGYSRAGRLVDELEWAGIVSGYSGSKAREILVDELQLEEILGQSGDDDYDE